MKIRERLLWLFTTGFLLGFVCFFIFRPSPHKNSITPLPIGRYPLLDLVESYLKKYYIAPTTLDPKKMIYSAAEGLYRATGDEYTTIFPPKVFKEFTSDISGKIAGIGVYLKKEGDDTLILSLVPNSPAVKAGLKIRDRLININEIPISNFSIDEISKRIQGEENSWVVLDIFRPSIHKYKTIKVLRSLISLPSVYSKMISDSVQYLKIDDFSDDTALEVHSALERYSKKAAALILDLRNNPGGQLESSNEITGFFLPENTPIVSTKGSSPEDNTTYTTIPNSLLFPLKKTLIVLINEQSASAAEILAAALQENKRALLVGKKTFGKGSIQSIFPLSYNDETFGVKITVAHYLTPSGKDINHIGIKPDISVDLPVITPLEQAKLDNILDLHLLEKFLGKNFNKPLSEERLKQIQEDLALHHLSISPLLLNRIIGEQKNMANGNFYTIEWEFDTQLAKALEIIKSKG